MKSKGFALAAILVSKMAAVVVAYLTVDSCVNFLFSVTMQHAKTFYLLREAIHW